MTNYVFLILGTLSFYFKIGSIIQNLFIDQINSVVKYVIRMTRKSNTADWINFEKIRSSMSCSILRTLKNAYHEIDEPCEKLQEWIVSRIKAIYDIYHPVVEFTRTKDFIKEVRKMPDLNFILGTYIGDNDSKTNEIVLYALTWRYANKQKTPKETTVTLRSVPSYFADNQLVIEI